MVGDMKTAPLEDNGDGVDNTASLALAFRTYSYRFFIKLLSPFKMIAALTAFVLISRHILHPDLSIKVFLNLGNCLEVSVIPAVLPFGVLRCLTSPL